MRLARRLLVLALVMAAGALACTPLGWRAGLTLLPGEERHDTEALDPAFAACLAALLLELTQEGYHPVIRTTWRDATRQQLYHRLGGSQRASGSLHQAVTADGRPAARAADVADLWPLFLVRHHAAFYLAMRDRAPQHGLVTGGSWAQRDPRWAAYGLGWDPGHVELDQGCPRPDARGAGADQDTLPP